MPGILIIADDLTGAADCGIACASSGSNTVVMLGNETEEPEADALSLDAGTREADPQTATTEIARLMRRYAKGERQIVYKKLDSTLRGNVASELAAVLSAQREIYARGDRIVAVLAPAFPANGRTTSQGRQLVNGRPLEEMGIWRCEGTGRRSHIPAILDTAGLRSALLDLKTVRSGDRNLRTEMTNAAERADVLICDAETDDDLRAIAEATVALGPGTVWAGSAGLAYYLPKATGPVRTKPISLKRYFDAGPTLFVIGSPAAVSRKQAEVLISSSAAIAIQIPPGDLLAGESKWRQHCLGLQEALSAGHDVVVMLAAEDEAERTHATFLCSALARLVAPYAGDVGALVATGGATARAVLQAWDISSLRLLQEIEPGVPFSVTEHWNRNLPVITKAGGFGNSQTLLHCCTFLHDLERASTTPRQLERL